MADPVLATDGYTYERQSIEQHWANQLQGEGLLHVTFFSGGSSEEQGVLILLDI